MGADYGQSTDAGVRWAEAYIQIPTLRVPTGVTLGQSLGLSEEREEYLPEGVTRR